MAAKRRRYPCKHDWREIDWQGTVIEVQCFKCKRIETRNVMKMTSAARKALHRLLGRHLGTQ